MDDEYIMIQEIQEAKASSKIVGFTCSSFDLLHAGHCAMLSEAKTHCDYLVVGLQTNPTRDRRTKNNPVQTVFERWTQLQAIKCVDAIIPYETESELLDLLYTIMPDIRMLGSEYEGTEYTGHDIDGISVVYNDRLHSFSSSSLRKRVHFAEQSLKS